MRISYWSQTCALPICDYKSLVTRSRALELRFNIILLVVSLLILAISIWVALWLANRLVSPIRRLVTAAERVGAGDLSARVSVRHSPDEIGTRSEEHTSELQSLMRISYAVFCLKKKQRKHHKHLTITRYV